MKLLLAIVGPIAGEFVLDRALLLERCNVGQNMLELFRRNALEAEVFHYQCTEGSAASSFDFSRTAVRWFLIATASSSRSASDMPDMTFSIASSFGIIESTALT